MLQIKRIFNKKIAIIFFLGILSAIPLPLILSTMKALLFEKGFDIATIGFLSLATLPYSLKIFYSPIIDSFSVPYLTKFLGQRKSWMILMQIILIISIAMLGLAGDKGNLFYISVLSFIVAFSSSCQDIVIDAYRIELFKEDQQNQGLAVTLYTYGYRIGLLISGAFALFLASFFSWKNVFFMMSSFILIGSFVVLLAEETRKNWTSKKYNFLFWFKQFVLAPFYNFIKRPLWYFIFAFIICFKLSDVFAGVLTMPFLLELQFTKIEIAEIVKTFGLFATLFGILTGGFLFKKLGFYKSLWIAAIAQMLSNFAFSYLANIGHNVNILYLVIFIENFSGGIGDAVFVAYLSGLCNMDFTATQYAILTSLATLSRGLFSSSAGIFATKLGWYWFFAFSAFLTIPSLIFLYFLRKKN